MNTSTENLQQASFLSFSINEESDLEVSIHGISLDNTRIELDNEHITTRWARLGMRYFMKMKDEGMFVESVPHVEPVRMAILFTNGEGASHLSRAIFDSENTEVSFDLSSDFHDYDYDYNDIPEYDKEVADKTISINLHCETTDRIGGLSTATAVSAMAVYRLLMDALSQVKA